jgi:hypothetical protein
MRKLAVALAVVTLPIMAWRMFHADDKLLFDRLWIDHMPSVPAELTQGVAISAYSPK